MPMITATTEHRWLAKDSALWLGILIGVAVTLAKLPLLFTTLGEQDQGRLIIDAVIYATDGPSTWARYGILTSPLWTLPLALIAAIFGASQLVLLTNIGGWLCGGVTTVLGFVLLRKLGAGPGWSAVGAVVTGLVPGTFYISLYGYPTQYALPLFLGSALAFAKSLESGQRKWLVWAWILYCGVVLMKVDFAIAGMFLLSIAILKGKTIDRKTAMLPAFALLAVGVAYIMGQVVIDGENLFHFLTNVGSRYPWSMDTLHTSSAVTYAYGCGVGTLLLFVAAMIVGLIRHEHRGMILRVAVAWAIGVLPLWLFWLARPPIVIRHAVPGILVTVLLAALVASRVFPRRRFVPVLWGIAIILINWPFGEPALDFNVRPSGNLWGGVVTNRRAYAVVDEVADRVAARRDPIKVFLGGSQTHVLGGVDPVPAIMVEIARDSQTARRVKARWAAVYEFTGRDGYLTKITQISHVNRALDYVGVPGVRYYALWTANLKPIERRRAPVEKFDLNAMFEQTEWP
jgi:hypothetical protein